jgi:hypothetical protein
MSSVVWCTQWLREGQNHRSISMGCSGILGPCPCTYLALVLSLHASMSSVVWCTQWLREGQNHRSNLTDNLLDESLGHLGCYVQSQMSHELLPCPESLVCSNDFNSMVCWLKQLVLRVSHRVTWTRFWNTFCALTEPSLRKDDTHIF